MLGVRSTCHGRLRADNPMFSGLVLSDGTLTVQELELRGVAPRRVVLAACEVASGVTMPGNETIGFVNALIARGTAGVLASLLPAPDRETGPLMARVHRRLAAGDRLAEALFSARSSLDTEEPTGVVNACGFTVFGAA